MRNTGELIAALTEIESVLEQAINKQMPGDDVPDRIAIPKLNRLEELHVRAAEASMRLKQMLIQYAQ